MAGAADAPSPAEAAEVPSPAEAEQLPSPTAAPAPDVGAAPPPTGDSAAAGGAGATTGDAVPASAGDSTGGAAASAAEQAADSAASAEAAAGAAQAATDDVRQPPQKVARVEDTSRSDYRAALVAHFDGEEKKSGQSQDWARAAEMQAKKTKAMACELAELDDLAPADFSFPRAPQAISDQEMRSALVAHFEAEEKEAAQCQDWARAANVQALKSKAMSCEPAELKNLAPHDFRAPQAPQGISDTEMRTALVAHFEAEEKEAAQSQDWNRAANMKALKTKAMSCEPTELKNLAPDDFRGPQAPQGISDAYILAPRLSSPVSPRQDQSVFSTRARNP